MNNENKKLSLAARFVKHSIRNDGRRNFNSPKMFLILMVLALVVAGANFYLANKKDDNAMYILGTLWVTIALIQLLKAGFMELIEKEYTKKPRTNHSTLR